MRHEVWLAIPTACPEMCRENIPRWKERGYRVALLQDTVRFDVPDADRIVHVERYEGWCKAVNLLCREVVPASATLIVTGGDDMHPDPNHTAEQLAEQFYGHFPDGFGVMQPHGDDFMFTPHYAGSPFFGRRWAESMYGGRGPVFEGYYHNWADNEIYWVARCLHAFWSRPDLTHYHDHHTRRPRAQGEFREKIDRRDLDDCRLFIARSWTRFPGHEPAGMHRPFDGAVIAGDTVRLAERRMAWWLEQERQKEQWGRSLSAALERCRDAGHRRVALVGIGSFLREAGAALMDPPVEIDCIVEEGRSGRLWGYPVVSQAEAARRNIDAVVVSATPERSEGWRGEGPLFSRGLEVFRVFGPWAAEKNERMARALAWCRSRGLRRVALYGAGAHTRDLGPCLESPGVEIACIIDDDARRAGESLFGRRIVTPGEALSMRLDAVVLSSDRFEAALWERAAPFRRAGVAVVRLYTDGLVEAGSAPACGTCAAA